MAYITTPDYLCFIVTRYDPVGNKVNAVISEALKGTGVGVYSATSVPAGAAVFEAIDVALRRADVVVLDVSQPTPNVMFEAGFALGRGVPLLIIAERGSRNPMPVQLRAMQVLVYDVNDFRPFATYIRRLVPSLAKSRRG